MLSCVACAAKVKKITISFGKPLLLFCRLVWQLQCWRLAYMSAPPRRESRNLPRSCWKLEADIRTDIRRVNIFFHRVCAGSLSESCCRTQRDTHTVRERTSMQTCPRQASTSGCNESSGGV